MPPVEYAPIGSSAGESAAYAVVIGWRAAARIARVGRRWRLEYAGFALTLASLPDAAALVGRYADKIVAGRVLELHEPAVR